MPGELRDLYCRMAAEPLEERRRMLQQQAWDMRKRGVENWKQRRLHDRVEKGAVISNSKKLHKIEVR